MQVFGALPTSSDVCDVATFLWAGTLFRWCWFDNQYWNYDNFDKWQTCIKVSLSEQHYKCKSLKLFLQIKLTIISNFKGFKDKGVYKSRIQNNKKEEKQ